MHNLSYLYAMIIEKGNCVRIKRKCLERIEVNCTIFYFIGEIVCMCVLGNRFQWKRFVMIISSFFGGHTISPPFLLNVCIDYWYF